MISSTLAFKSSDGAIHSTLEEAQHADLRALFTGLESSSGQSEAIAACILENADRILDILSTTKRSRPARRLVNGYQGKKQGHGKKSKRFAGGAPETAPPASGQPAAAGVSG